MPNRPWEWESRRERRKRQIEAFQRAASDALVPLSQGDYAGARAALRGGQAATPSDPRRLELPERIPSSSPAWSDLPPTVPTSSMPAGKAAGGVSVPKREQPKKSKGWLDRLGSELLDLVPGPVESAGRKALDYAQVPGDWSVGATVGQLGELEMDPETGRPVRRYSGESALRGVGRWLAEPFAAAADLALPGNQVSPGERQRARERALYEQAGVSQDSLLDRLRNIPRAGREFSTAEEIPVGLRVGAGVALDPTSWLGPGAIRGGLSFLPEGFRAARGVRQGISAADSLLTSPAGATIGGAAGAGIGAQIAANAGGGSTAQILATLGGGLVGGGIGGGLTPERAVRGIDASTAAQERALGRLGLDASPEAGEVMLPGARPATAASGPTFTPESRRTLGRILQTIEPTSVVASLYGKLPFLRERGIGQMPEWLVNAPDAYSSESLIPLKNLLETDPALPVSARISNRFWETLGAFNPRFRTRLDDSRVRQIGVAYRLSEDAIPHIADTMSQVDGVKAFEGLARDELGRALVNGKPVQFVNENGVPVPRWYAGWADILENPGRYPEVMATLSPEQRAAQAALSAKLNQIQSVSRDMGIKVEGAVVPGEGGVYVPRGRPRPVGKEDVPVSYRGQRYEGRRAGSTQERRWKSQAEAIAKGYAYPDPVAAVQQYVTENLRQQNAVHAASLLKRIPLGDRPIGAAVVPASTADELTGLRSEIRPRQREMRQLKRDKHAVDRDVRLESRFQRHAFERHVQLRETLESQTATAEQKATAARESFTTAREHLDDVLSAARELSAKTAAATSEHDTARRELRQVLDEASALSRRLDEIADEAEVASDIGENAEMLARISNFPRALYREAEEAWKSAEQVKHLAAREAARVERKLLGIGLLHEDVDARLQDAKTAARKAKAQFSEALTGADGGTRSTAIDMAEAARDEAKAAANVRGAMTEGKISELRRVFAQRQLHALDLVQRQTKLGQRIAELSAELEPLTTRRHELLAQVADTRRLGRSRDMEFSGEVNLDPLRGVPVPADLANAFNKYLSGGERGHGVAFLDLVNNTFRSLGATLDASRQMTVGLVGQADKPLVALKGVKGGIDAARDPSAAWRQLDEIQARWKARGIDVSLEEAVGRHGLQIAAGESTLIGTARKGTFEEKLARLPVIRQADALYSAPGNIERVERFYQTLSDLRRDGRDWRSPQARAAAANIANLVSGRARRGVLSPFVGEEVSGRIAFAGRFVESQFELAANAILTGGVEGYEARRALLRLALGGTALTYALNEMLGEETTWDPRDANFLRVRVMGRDVSLFGPWDSLVKGVVAAAQGNPERFVRSEFAPLPALGYDLTRGGGKNPVGEPVGFGSVEGALNTAPVPFGIRDIAEGAMDTRFDDPTSIGALGFASAAAIFGIKNSPLTPTERLNEIARTVIDPETGRLNDKDFYDSSFQVRDIIKREHPTLWEEKVRAGTQQTQRAEEVKAQFKAEQERRDASLLSGEITVEQWKAARGDAYARKDGMLDEIWRDADFPERDDGVMNAYFDASETWSVDGIFDADARQAYLDSLSDGDRAHLEANLGPNATPLEKLYRRLSREYYGLPAYRGYSASDGRAIDDTWQDIRNEIVVSTNTNTTRTRMLRVLAQKVASGAISDALARGVRRRILGMLVEDRQREYYKRRNAAAFLVAGNGRVPPLMAEAIRQTVEENERREGREKGAA